MSDLALCILDILPNGSFSDNEGIVFYPGPHYLVTFQVYSPQVVCLMRRGEKLLEMRHSLEDRDMHHGTGAAATASLVVHRFQDFIEEENRKVRVSIKELKQWQVRLDHLLDVLGGEE